MALSAADAFKEATGWVYVLTVGDNAPPGGPSTGDRHVVGTAGSGAWSSHSRDIARYNGSAWVFVDPDVGMRVFSAADRTVYCYDGSAWTAVLTIASAYTDEQAQDAVGGMLDTTLEYVDGTPLLRRAALTGHVTAPAGSNETTIPSNTIASTMLQGGSVTNAKIRDGAGLSVIGVAGNASAQVADIVAATDADVLRRDGTAIGFGKVKIAAFHADTAASDTQAGISELATTAEIDAGSDAARVVAVDQLAASRFGTASLTIPITDSATDAAVGDGVWGVPIPASMNGMDIVAVRAVAYSAGATGTTDFQLRRRRAGASADVLSTKITMAAQTLCADGVIDTSNDDLATGDILFADVDAVETTAPKGVQLIVEARMP